MQLAPRVIHVRQILHSMEYVIWPELTEYVELINEKTELQIAPLIDVVFLLLIYNIGFIIPLLGVFGMIFAGISSKKAAGVFQKNIS